MVTEIFYGCDIDMRHGAIAKITLDTTRDLVLKAESVYRWGGKGSFYLREKDNFPTMMRWIQTIADNILGQASENRNIYVEWDKNRIHYAKARKLAVVQLAQAVGALGAYIGPRMKLVTPREVKLLQPEKTRNWGHMKVMLEERGFFLHSNAQVETLDTKGDFGDSLVAGLAGYRKNKVGYYETQSKEQHERDF